ncbi:MAG: NAD(P)H-dependent oxidoreductase [Allosphingosinicella sp.]|uniref:NAD(P)H-dependent oxidoreductase n=1 Tax=Allosphingosinicella sp. TaxID=2823234 RepID=UPI00392BEE5D
MTRVAIVDGHPDPEPGRFVHALADAYADGAAEAGHEVRRIDVAKLGFPLIRGRDEWQSGQLPPDIREAQETLRWADHLLFVYPMWLGDMPALFKGFMEQVARPDFAFRYREGGTPEKLLKGKTARVLVTMGMPGFIYRIVYRAHSLKSFERNILRFVGIRPRSDVIGGVEGSGARRQRWLAYVRELGFRAA